MYRGLFLLPGGGVPLRRKPFARPVPPMAYGRARLWPVGHAEADGKRVVVLRIARYLLAYEHTLLINEFFLGLRRPAEEQWHRMHRNHQLLIWGSYRVRAPVLGRAGPAAPTAGRRWGVPDRAGGVRVLAGGGSGSQRGREARPGAQAQVRAVLPLPSPTGRDLRREYTAPADRDAAARARSPGSADDYGAGTRAGGAATSGIHHHAGRHLASARAAIRRHSAAWLRRRR